MNVLRLVDRGTGRVRSAYDLEMLRTALLESTFDSDAELARRLGELRAAAPDPSAAQDAADLEPPTVRQGVPPIGGSSNAVSAVRITACDPTPLVGLHGFGEQWVCAGSVETAGGPETWTFRAGEFTPADLWQSHDDWDADRFGHARVDRDRSWWAWAVLAATVALSGPIMRAAGLAMLGRFDPAWREGIPR